MFLLFTFRGFNLCPSNIFWLKRLFFVMQKSSPPPLWLEWTRREKSACSCHSWSCPPERETSDGIMFKTLTKAQRTQSVEYFDSFNSLIWTKLKKSRKSLSQWDKPMIGLGSITNVFHKKLTFLSNRVSMIYSSIFQCVFPASIKMGDKCWQM